MEWINVNDRMPEEHDSIFAKLKGTPNWNPLMFEKISDEVLVTVEFEDKTRKIISLHTIDGEWKDDFMIKKKYIAWTRYPKPFMD